MKLRHVISNRVCALGCAVLASVAWIGCGSDPGPSGDEAAASAAAPAEVIDTPVVSASTGALAATGTSCATLCPRCEAAGGTCVQIGAHCSCQ